MKLTQKEAISKHKYGIDLKAYPMDNNKIGLVYIDVKAGHFEEFYHKKVRLLTMLWKERVSFI